MWFLQAWTLSLILICCAALAGLSHILRNKRALRHYGKALLAFDLLIIILAGGKYLALFYLAYTALTYFLVVLLRRAERFRRILLVVFSVLFVLPFFYIRLTGVLSALPMPIALIGIAYNMLKAVDALFYVYYAAEPIDPLVYANFMLFFPVLTAGPIYRYRDFKKQYEAPLPPGAREVEKSVKRLIWGLFKKLVILWALQLLFDRLLDQPALWYRSVLVIALSYLIVYLDLSGYSDIAVAAGGLIGFSVPENFKNPLTATSFTQFWRKWHVTLSDWIREHIFVVVQGKKIGRMQSALIGFLTMIIMSLWHDFSPLGALSGVFIGIFLVIENLFGLTTYSRRQGKKSVYVLRCAAVTALFAVNCTLFLMPIGRAGSVLAGLLAFGR